MLKKRSEFLENKLVILMSVKEWPRQVGKHRLQSSILAATLHLCVHE